MHISFTFLSPFLCCLWSMALHRDNFVGVCRSTSHDTQTSIVVGWEDGCQKYDVMSEMRSRVSEVGCHESDVKPSVMSEIWSRCYKWDVKSGVRSGMSSLVSEVRCEVGCQKWDVESGIRSGMWSRMSEVRCHEWDVKLCVRNGMRSWCQKWDVMSWVS